MVRHPVIAGVTIQGELGRGAYSVVYRVDQNGTRAALKVPRSTARWTKWVYREAVALARVRHPALPAVLEVGEADGLPYLLMELVEGETLADRLRKNPNGLPESEVVDLGRQLAHVLGAVHAAGLVHRDVKPRNIVLERATGRLRLVDFGFASPMERIQEQAGTEAYAAPEQFTPPGIVDGRADLYAVGKVMGECLAPGISSLRRTRTTAAPWGDRGVDASLSAIVERLTEARPDARFPTADALLAALATVRLGRFTAPPIEPPSVALPGRSSDLRRSVHHLSDVRHGGTVLVLRGVRGAGKSRFLGALPSHAPTFRRHVHVECRPNDAPLTTLRRVFEAVLAIAPSGEPVVFAESLRPIADLLLPKVAVPRVPTNEVPVLAPEALGEGAAELLLDRLATGDATLVTVDDVQWMDAASADALVRFATRLSNVPLGLVLAARPVTTSLLDRLRKSGLSRLLSLDLGALDAQQTREIIESYLSFAPAEDRLVRAIHALSDGTPLGVLEVLGSILDAGVLRPHARSWLFDEARLSEAALPKGSVALLGRRLGDLPPATRKVLDAAAVIGPAFEDEILAKVVGVSTEDIGYAIAVAARAGLVLSDPGHGASHRFVHDSLRELLVEEVAGDRRASLHLEVARVFESRTHRTFEEECAIAEHFAAASSIADAEQIYGATQRAGEAALRRYDNTTALRFLSLARAARERSGRHLDARLLRSIGEAHVRLGSLDEGLRAFEEALARADDPLLRSDLFGRVSWVFQTKALPDEAWRALREAFESIGERLPTADLPSVVATSLRYVRRPRRTRDAAEVELLNQLHYQNARLGLEYGRPARLIQSTLNTVKLSRGSSSVRAQARSHALYAFLLTAFGLPQKAKLALAVADQTAARSEDPATRGFCAQVGFMTEIYGGRLDEALVLLRACVDTYGPWLELNEYCQNIATAETIQALRGRATEAAEWMNKSVERVRRSQSRLSIVAVMHRARASYAAIGRSVEADPWLAEELRAVPLTDPGRGYHRLSSWGPRARYYVEVDQLGAEFDALVRAFSAERHSPRKAHVVLAEVYVAIAQARMHQALRANASTRARLVEELRSAADDLRHCTPLPLFKCHSLAADGTLAFLDGDRAKAGKILATAEQLANEQSCPWVLYSVARTRAHMLRALGKAEAAHDQARAAELFARDHGAVTRLRWIREEFDLADTTVDAPAPSRAGSSSRANRQLNTLLQVARAPRRDLKAEQQAGSILDELIASLSAERGAIWFQPEAGGRSTAVARHRDDEASVSIAADSVRGTLLRRVERGGATWPGPAFETEPTLSEHFDPERTIAVPLFLYERSVGALCIERGPRDVPFHPDDRSLLLLLSHQVPIALEIARLLYEREQLHASLQHAKKMEAVGALAGGLAHDFNNMLAAMRVALSAAQERANGDAELLSELDIIAQATTRAAQLTSQLLGFSRHQAVPVAVHDVNQLVTTLEPMLHRVLGGKIRLLVELSPTDSVEVDQGAFDQALVNLLMNARDAMPHGGTLTIRTRNVVLGDTAAQRANVPVGEYVEIDVIDTGEGMTQETMSRIFEPFFSTKPPGSGTGLGLAMVYAFTRNCGGSIEVSSDVGKGTQFRLYLKRATRPRTSRPARPTSKPVQRNAPDTILVVDDDDLVRRSISKILKRNGYRVVAASGSVEALDVAREQGPRIALVILDVLMPGVSGPELGRRLFELELPAKILFVSGFAPESIPIEEGQVSADMLLQKPFSQSMLLDRVRQLMPS